MANLGFSLRLVLGLIPKTEKIESEQQSLKAEYDKLITYSKSDELEEYLSLKALINSDDFKSNKNKITGLNYKSTDEFQKEVRFKKLKNNKTIINYFKVLNSNELAQFIETEASADLKNYLELIDYLGSIEHKNIVSEFDQNLANEKNKYQELKKLEKSKAIKEYFKTLNTGSYKNYTNLVDSNELTEYVELDEFVGSKNLQEFKKAVLEQLNAEKNKVNELKELKNNPVVKAFYNSKDKENTQKPDEVDEVIKLEALLNSADYKKKLQELEYKNTAEYAKESKFLALKKSNKFVDYFKFINSNQFKQFNSVKQSADLKRFEELKAYIASTAHQQALADYTYNKSDEYKKEAKYAELKKNPKIANWEKYQKAKSYLLFKSVENSELLKEFQQLEETVTSEKFTELKTYLLDKNKWMKTDEHKQEVRFNELEKSSDVKWYFAVKDSSKFNELKAWNLTFEDDFNSGKVDDVKWMNSYFWGKMLLNDRYVLAGDKQFYTDNKNTELNGTTLKIITKKENAKGKVWHPVHGFSTQNFEYTSGMLSTAHSFRQLYGRVEAKIKLNSEYPVYQAFWLKGEKILPEVDVFKFNMDKKNRFQMSTIWGDANNSKAAKRQTEKISGSSLANNYFIYSLDWTENKLTWKINGIEVFSTSSGVPNEPLYMLLSSGIQQKPEQEIGSAAFEIDWVRWYEKA